ncbi:MAG: hypothetical protein M5U28_28435 [Sandaracinaceae bacterium]|nr:hypothetical protein [Sandaracinaceae bacterium]
MSHSSFSALWLQVPPAVHTSRVHATSSSHSASLVQPVGPMQPMDRSQVSPAPQRSFTVMWLQMLPAPQLSTVHAIASSHSSSVSQLALVTQPRPDSQT